MVTLPRPDRMCVEELLGLSSGYVLDLSNREFADLLRDELGVDVQDLRYSSRGTSKANRLRCIIEECEADAVARLLRALWDVREQRGWTPGEIVEPRPSVVRRRYMEVVLRLERMANISDTDALTAFVESATLEELIEAIQRDVAAGRHAAALDRLHTYCMKRFTNLLDGAGLPHVREEPLQNRVGKYVRWLIDTRSPRPMTQQILKNAMGILQQFNDIRNNRSFAHDNDLIEPDEARLIFDSVVAILRFVEHAQNGATPKLP
jgi:hypothetical protein